MITREQLGGDEVERRLREMREIAEEVMTVIEDFDPFLIGSVLSGNIKRTSDIDLHAYCDDTSVLAAYLEDFGYQDIEVECVENRKGVFVHIKWSERSYPVELTVYPWSWRDLTLFSSVTSKPMKRVDIDGLRRLLRR